ncbi:hypothetical protein EVAR_23043_1 [Eumeta japonica]|uniref:Uncharacterized protein n=1 Tax=Eumeta variegata TaxID=151549 RepID=A0A4C1UQ60_EUMVA|nr:hypothetical protein EVAR_23043_1 [Eumeta japonica]
MTYSENIGKDPSQVTLYFAEKAISGAREPEEGITHIRDEKGCKRRFDGQSNKPQFGDRNSNERERATGRRVYRRCYHGYSNNYTRSHCAAGALRVSARRRRTSRVHSRRGEDAGARAVAAARGGPRRRSVRRSAAITRRTRAHAGAGERAARAPAKADSFYESFLPKPKAANAELRLLFVVGFG